MKKIAAHPTKLTLNVVLEGEGILLVQGEEGARLPGQIETPFIAGSPWRNQILNTTKSLTRNHKPTIMKTVVTTLSILSLCIMSGCKTHTDAPKDMGSQTETKTTLLSVAGATLPYFVEGEGFPCIVVSDGELVSRALSQELKHHFQFIFLNGRMNVPETGAIQDLSFDVLAEDVEALRKTLRLKRVGVFGHSISGLIALEYSRQYPKHTAFVIMNGTIPFLDTRSSHIERCYWKTNASAERKMSFTNAWRGISRSALHKHWSSDAAKTVHTLDAAQIFYDCDCDATPLLKDTYWNMRVWSHIYGHLMPQYNLNNSRAIKVPVFLALGKEDYYVPYILWEEETVHIPNLSVNLFDKSGHYAFYEEEQLFRERLLAWIKSLNLVAK